MVSPKSYSFPQRGHFGLSETGGSGEPVFRADTGWRKQPTTPSNNENTMAPHK